MRSPSAQHAAGQRAVRIDDVAAVLADRRARSRPRRGCPIASETSRSAPAGKSRTRRSGRAADRVGIEDDDVGGEPDREPAAVARGRRARRVADVSRRTPSSSESTPFSRTQCPSRWVGAHASQSWLAWAPASERPSTVRRVARAARRPRPRRCSRPACGSAPRGRSRARGRASGRSGRRRARPRPPRRCAPRARARPGTREITIASQLRVERGRRLARSRKRARGTRGRRRCASCPRGRPRRPA